MITIKSRGGSLQKRKETLSKFNFEVLDIRVFVSTSQLSHTTAYIHSYAYWHGPPAEQVKWVMSMRLYVSDCM